MVKNVLVGQTVLRFEWSMTGQPVTNSPPYSLVPCHCHFNGILFINCEGRGWSVRPNFQGAAAPTILFYPMSIRRPLATAQLTRSVTREMLPAGCLCLTAETRTKVAALHFADNSKITCILRNDYSIRVTRFYYNLHNCLVSDM